MPLYIKHQKNIINYKLLVNCNVKDVSMLKFCNHNDYTNHNIFNNFNINSTQIN